MKRNGRLVSGLVLGFRYGMGDITCQYLQATDGGGRHIGATALVNETANFSSPPLGLGDDGDVAGVQVRPVNDNDENDSNSRAPSSTSTSSGGFVGPIDFVLNHWDIKRTASFVTFSALYFGVPGGYVRRSVGRSVAG